MHIGQYDIELLDGYYMPVEYTMEDYKARVCEAVNAGSNNTLTVRSDPGIHDSYVRLSIGSMIGGLCLHKTDG